MGVVGPRIQRAGDPELPLLVVDSDELRLVFAPTRGGRLLSLRAGGTELLWQNPELLDDDLRPRAPLESWPRGDGAMSTWANVGGSKTWPAPQGWSGEGEWAGPPDLVLDSGSWTASVDDDGDRALVVLTSGDDPRSGLRVTRSFRIPAAGAEFVETVTFTNVTDHPVRWSIWEVCQVDTSGSAGAPLREAAVVVPVRPGSRVLGLGQWFGELEEARASGAVRLAVGTAVAKRGFVDVDGSVTYCGSRGESLTIAMDPIDDAAYPDGGAQVEVWFQMPTPTPIAELGDLHPSADLVELEVLGPLVLLEPGGSTRSTVRWSATGAVGDVPR